MSILNEENYQKTKKKIATIALIVLLIGWSISGCLIYKGIEKNNEVNSKYSTDSKADLAEEIALEKEKLVALKEDLEAQGIEYSNFAKYTDGKSYDLKVIVNVLDPSFAYYKFDEYKNNSITARYCSLMEQQNNAFSNFNKEFEKAENTGYFAIGGFIMFASAMFAGMIYMISKGREITAFQAQQVMPVAQEGLEKMAPTMAKVGKTMAEEMAPTVKNIAKDMAPAYGEIAKEIAKGIKDGMKDGKEENKKD